MTVNELYERLTALALKDPVGWLVRLWPHRRREIAEAMAAAGVETDEEFDFALAIAQQARQPKPKAKRTEASGMPIIQRPEFDATKTHKM